MFLRQIFDHSSLLSWPCGKMSNFASKGAQNSALFPSHAACQGHSDYLTCLRDFLVASSTWALLWVVPAWSDYILSNVSFASSLDSAAHLCLFLLLHTPFQLRMCSVCFRCWSATRYILPWKFEGSMCVLGVHPLYTQKWAQPYYPYLVLIRKKRVWIFFVLVE